MLGHFSQVVWKESREVGVGRARTNDGKVVVVTNYRPAGNRPGAYSTNVLPPSDTSKYEQTGTYRYTYFSCIVKGRAVLVSDRIRKCVRPSVRSKETFQRFIGFYERNHCSKCE